MALGDSISFSLHRDEGLKELKEQNWEVPLQDGEASGPGGPCCGHQTGRRALGHWTSLMCCLLSRTSVPDLPRSCAVRGAVGGQCGGESLSNKLWRSSHLRPAPWPSKHAVAGTPSGASQWPSGHAQPPGEAHAGGGIPGAGPGWECGWAGWELGSTFPPALPPQSLFEVVTSEASYLRSLQLLTDTFVLSQALRDTLTPRDHHTLFSNVQRVQEVSEWSVGSCPLSELSVS